MARPTAEIDLDDIMAERLNVVEGVIEKHFIRECAEYGCIQHKVLGVRTWPDRNLYWPVGVCDMVELKRPKGGRYEKGQKEKHAELTKMGFTCVTLKTKGEVNRWLRERAAMLGVPKRAQIPRQHRDGSLSAAEYLAKLK